MTTAKTVPILSCMLPTRLPKRYLALAFAICIGLLALMDGFDTSAKADAFDRLFDGKPSIGLSAGVSLAE